MAVESTISGSLAGKNRRETEEPKRKPRSTVINFPRVLCSGRSTKSRPPEKSRFRCLHIDPSSSSGSSSPEKPSPVQMPGASPHFMKATACYDAKKECFQGGVECDDLESVDSSRDSKIKNSKGVRKGIKSFGSTRSFRKGRSRRIMKPTGIQSEPSDSGHFRASPQGSETETSFDSSDQSSQSNMASSSAKSFQTLMRSSSLRALRVSFKSRKHSAKTVEKATCSSTIKNSKFPAKVELLAGPAESERLSVYRVCSYHHCSLNGHSHGSSSSSTPPKGRRRWSKPRNESIDETTEMSPVLDPSVKKGILRENTRCYDDADLVEIIFGETSFPEKNYQETLNQVGKTADWCCSCNSSKTNVITEEFREEIGAKSVPDKGVIVNPTPSEAKSSSLSMWNLIHHHMVSGSDSNGSDEADHADDDSNKLPSSSVDADSCDADQDGENQEIEARKLFAIKLVREAIEKILLPEVSDQSSDDQSILENNQDNASAQEHYTDTDSNQDEANALSGSKESEPSASAEEVKTAMKSEKKAPKHWSNLKKWILLQRFIKELEKVKKINPRKPQQLQPEHDPEPETVRLRPRVVDEKRRTEEWMLDYALQQAVSQLEPTQRRKVEVLVRAFETMVPPQGGNNIEAPTLPKSKSNGEENLQMQMAIMENNKVADAENVDLTESMSGAETNDLEKRKYISMWHMISQHVLSGVVSKAGTEFLDGTDDEVEEPKTHHSVQDLSKPHDDKDAVSENLDSGNQRRNFSRDDAIKLVREVVNEILVTQPQDDSSDTQSVMKQIGNGDSALNKTEGKEGDMSADEVSLDKTKSGMSKFRNWSKLKKLLLLKRSIMALESARKLKFAPRKDLPQTLPNPEPEKVDLRHQMVDERKKAEEWMLDYAVQNIVTKLTPARKRRVAMLVEAFEAVVPLPEV